MQKTDELVLASVGNRFLANLIDYFLINIATMLIAYLVGIPIFNLDFQYLNSHPEALSELYTQLLMVLVPTSFFYRFFQESSRYQATLGKRILKLRVVRTTGEPLSYKDAFIRNAVKEISGYFYMVYIYGLFSRFHQCIHDVAARTYVVDNV
ncbi:RDD family protein [Siphonobacter sp.]|uniref:RDD family protein n=1 Tax=Siphonobacter sp. TaxID=1869184 RepID=UPI003B3BBC07